MSLIFMNKLKRNEERMQMGDADLNERGQVQWGKLQPRVGRMVNEQVKKNNLPANERCDAQVENPRVDECSSHTV